MSKVRTIFCCGCQTDVQARLTSGREVYPHRDDLASLPFWKCDGCGNTVERAREVYRVVTEIGARP